MSLYYCLVKKIQRIFHILDGFEYFHLWLYSGQNLVHYATEDSGIQQVLITGVSCSWQQVKQFNQLIELLFILVLLSQLLHCRIFVSSEMDLSRELKSVTQLLSVQLINSTSCGAELIEDIKDNIYVSTKMLTNCRYSNNP